VCGAAQRLWLEQQRHLAGATNTRRRELFFHASQPGLFQHHGDAHRGRPARFNEGDRANSPKVAVVNQSFVKKILNGGNPIGARFQIEEEVGRARPVYEIVGLVRDTKVLRLAR